MYAIRSYYAEIAAVKVLTPQVLHDIVYRSLHIHGSLGTSNEMPLIGMWAMMPVMGIADGPTEVHKLTVARQVLKGYKPRITSYNVCYTKLLRVHLQGD